MAENDNDQDIDAWKAKYYESIGDLERRESEWQRFDSLLRDAMARMCVALEGLHSDLDAKIARLRRALRSGAVTDDLAKLSREVTETLDHLDSQAKPAARSKPQRSAGGLGRWFRRPARGEETDKAVAPASASLGVGEALMQLLERLDIVVRKMLPGKITVIDAPEGPLVTRSLLLTDLAAEESMRLQQRGLGH